MGIRSAPGTVVLTQVRLAQRADVATIRACVEAAYAKYVPRIGKKPAPMLADYDEEVAAGHVHVLEISGRVVGLIVMFERGDHLFIENVAVHPGHQDAGHGRRLMEFAEERARDRGFRQVRLHTNAKMFENVEIYGKLGYVETGRGHEDGYNRVFMTKRLRRHVPEGGD